MNPGLYFRKGLTLLAFLSLGVAGEVSAYTHHRPSVDEPMLARVDPSFSDIFMGPLTLQPSLPSGHVVLPPEGFTSVSLLDSTDHQVGALGQSESNFSYSGSSQAAGLSSYHVSGNADQRSGGTYVVSLQTLTLPEPSEWVMILAGLGLVSMIARRRIRSI